MARIRQVIAWIGRTVWMPGSRAGVALEMVAGPQDIMG
jgi:hypothetical protein